MLQAMENIPFYKTLIAVICTAIIGLGIASLSITLFGAIVTRECLSTMSNIILLLIGCVIAVTCFLIGRLYLRWSKDKAKYYYHTLWTGGWSVAVVMLVLVTLFFCMI